MTVTNIKALGGYQNIAFRAAQQDNAATASPANNSTKMPESKGDTVTLFGKEIKKKHVIAGGIIGGATIVGITVAVINHIKKGKIGQATKAAKEMLAEATGLSEKVNSTVAEVSKLAAGSSNKNVKIEGDIIKEFDNAGKLIRKTTLESGSPKKIVEYLEDNKKNIITLSNGDSTRTFKGQYEKVADGVEKWAQELVTTKDGNPSMYAKNVEKTSDGIKTFAKKILIKDGKADGYFEKIQQKGNDIQKYAFGLEFKDGEASKFIKGFEKLQDGTEKIKRTFVPDNNGKWQKAKPEPEKAA